MSERSNIVEYLLYHGSSGMHGTSGSIKKKSKKLVACPGDGDENVPYVNYVNNQTL